MLLKKDILNIKAFLNITQMEDVYRWME